MKSSNTNNKTINIDGIDLYLSKPTQLNMKWVGDKSLLRQIHACWLMLDKDDYPLAPRLIGKPGVGKTTLAYAAAQKLKRPIYLFQATMDTRPEDLIITPVLESGSKIRYVASSLLSAMITGGTIILDEGNRMSEKAWASLAPLLDTRRYVESLVAGIQIKAHEDFRFCATMNDDASTFDLPEYIHSRLQPKIFIDFPDAEDELKILQANLPYAEEDVLAYLVKFLQRGHKLDEGFSVRDGINIGRFAYKMASATKKKPGDFLEQGIIQILGEESLSIMSEEAGEFMNF